MEIKYSVIIPAYNEEKWLPRTLAGLKTAEDWNRHVAFIRKSMAAWTGPLPKRTPLRARVTGRINRDKYTLEKVLFESRPNFLVSANLYLPRGYSDPRPAVLNLIGHSAAGKATDKVQRRAIAQARKGFVALVIDCSGICEAPASPTSAEITSISVDLPLAPSPTRPIITSS